VLEEIKIGGLLIYLAHPRRPSSAVEKVFAAMSLTVREALPKRKNHPAVEWLVGTKVDKGL
jgi:hypothetical protein